MTKIDIEQIKADRAAGKQGPWKIHHRQTPWALDNGRTGFHNEYWIYTAYDHPQLKGPDPVIGLSKGVGTPESGNVDLVWLNEQDANRIARLSDLEAALIEAVEDMQNIIDLSHNDPLGTSKVIDMRNVAKGFLERLTGEAT